METVISKWLLPNWERKLIAIIAAIVVWMYVSQSITATKTIPGIPIRVVNLSPEKTIEGLLPNGILSKRINLTLTGTEKVIQNLGPEDIEVVLDAMNVPDEWVVQVTKKNLVSLNPDIDLSRNITNVQHQEFVIELTRLITAKIPVTILPPSGDAPPGYELLDIWPTHLEHTISGPEEQVQTLKGKGLELTFDLNLIKKDDLDRLVPPKNPLYGDEVSFSVPDSWKKVAIPFLNNALEAVNDPDATQLQVNFLKSEYIPINDPIPVRVFYPLKFLDIYNPKTLPLLPSSILKSKNDTTYLSLPLFAYRVSRLFLDLLIEYMELTIIAGPMGDKEYLDWSLDFIDPQMLEDRYVNALKARIAENPLMSGPYPQRLEEMWRQRFRAYMHNITLYKSPNQIFQLNGVIEEKKGILLKDLQ
jgi:hypothetical protein